MRNSEFKTRLRAQPFTGVSVAALGCALLLSAGAAQAQTSPAPEAKAEPDAIVVTGFRRSVENAIKIKKLSTSIVESITSEDVGKLPDVSITDALSRLPGVTSQRLQGRADVLSIRGLGPDFSTALFNHREIVSVGDNRGFQYDQIPGELLNRVDVIKTPFAGLIGQGLAGTVDMQTISPLDQKKRVFAISAQGEKNAYSKLNPDAKDTGYKASLIYSDKFMDNTVGISIGLNAISSPVQDKQYEAWGFPTDNSGNYILGGGKWFANSNNLTRQSAFGRIEYRPSSKFEMSIDGLYSKYKTKEYQRGLEVPLWWGGLSPSSVTTSNGFDTSATFPGVHAVQRNNYNQRDADSLALGWNAKFAVSDSVKLTVDASYSRAHRHDYLLETYTGLGYNKAGTADTVTVKQLANGTYSLSTTLNYNDPSKFVLTDPQGWGYNGTTAVVQAGFLNAPDFVDNMKALRANLNGQIHSSLFKSWEVGVNYGDRKKTAGYKSYFLQPGQAFAVNTLAIPSNILVGGVTPANFLTGQTLAYNAQAAAGLLFPAFDNRPDSLARDYVVEEKVLTGYAQVNIDGILGALPVRGNVGVQVVNTDQSSTGSSANLTGSVVTAVPVSDGAKYTYALPSVNLSIEVARNTFLRIGAARTLARARMDDERVTYTVSFTPNGNGQLDSNGKQTYFSGGGGNSRLRPYIADGVDLSLEKYFANGRGLVSLAGFYKALSGYVDPNNGYQADFSGYKSLVPTTGTTFSGNYNGIISAPANTGRGYIQGFEGNLTLPFALITKGLDGFGLLANGSYTDSSVKFAQGQAVTVPGLSDKVASVQFFFEKWGFAARASYTYRSSFLAEVSGLSATPSYRTAKAQNILDAHIGYDFKTGALNGLSIYAEAGNLLNSPFVTYNNNDPRQVINYENYGATYRMGATFKF